jgi:hypothetical protein
MCITRGYEPRKLPSTDYTAIFAQISRFELEATGLEPVMLAVNTISVFCRYLFNIEHTRQCHQTNWWMISRTLVGDTHFAIFILSHTFYDNAGWHIYITLLSVLHRQRESNPQRINTVLETADFANKLYLYVRNPLVVSCVICFPVCQRTMRLLSIN